MRPTHAEIDLAAIRHNVRQIRAAVGPAVKMIAVVKANAYGHGAIPVSRAALSAGVDSLAVALPEEGMELREAGITVPILILGLTLPEQAHLLVRHQLTAAVATQSGAAALAEAARRAGATARVLLKLDTGMGRVGLQPREARAFLSQLAALPNLEVLGLYTHLATADSADKTYANTQLKLFQTALAELAADVDLPVLSAANSAAVMDLPDSHHTAVRPGIILYGLPPSGEILHMLDLKPAMSLKTRIVFIKECPAGTPVGYGSTHITPNRTFIATLPLGYADGYFRQLSNKSQVLVHGKRRPVVGRVCMDQAMIDLGPVCDANIGDEAVLFGRQGEEEITATELAALAGTINYELVCAVSARVPRVYLNE